MYTYRIKKNDLAIPYKVYANTRRNFLEKGNQTTVVCRAGLKHVRGVRPNRAADFRGAILDPTMID